jgi:hypothetical protein
MRENFRRFFKETNSMLKKPNKELNIDFTTESIEKALRMNSF